MKYDNSEQIYEKATCIGNYTELSVSEQNVVPSI